MTVNRNEERVAEGTSGSGPSRPVGNKLTQVANAGRQSLSRVSGAGKKPGKGRKRSTAERSKDAASGRKRRFFNYPRAGKGKIHRWIPSWRFVLGVFLLGVLSTVGAFMWAYNTIKVPKPSEFALAQSSTVYYADGTTEMGKFAEINRQSVDASTLPDYVGNAVVASEDRSFYSNKGVDPKGIARALVNNLRGGDTQGASTLTQQYVKNYYVDTTSSYSGKFKQAIMAIKIDREKPKKEILGDYLNTVYYGRGAYGIEAASQAFFGHPAKDMKPSEAALLAGILPSPSAWDPAENPKKAQERWGRVLQFMLDDGYITQAQYNEAKQKGMPDVKESQTKQIYAGTNGYLLQMVRAELETKAKVSPEQIDTGGFKIVTTINQKDQEAAVKAVDSLPPGASPNLRKALVSIDPKTGGLLALYGGEDYLTSQVNTSTDAIAQAGSTFKPFALVAALENGWSLDSGYPATSPMTIEGHEFQNFKNVSLKWASLTQATEQSLNTPYLQLNQELLNAPDLQDQKGVTAKVANRAGYPENTEGLKTPEQRMLVQNVLGSASPHTIDIATAYSTFASQGIRHDTHIVASLKNPDGTDRYAADTKGHREFDEDVMADTTYALQQVVNGANGSADKVAALGRPVAAKTGSSSDNKSAQFVGFTPQVVTAVTLYQSGTDGSEESIEPWGEYDEITGSTYPADIFLNYMTVAHEGLEVEKFPPPAELLATRGGTAPQTAKPTGEPEEEATATPTAPPEATAPPTQQPTAEPTPQGTPQPEGNKTEPSDSQKKPGDDQGGIGDGQEDRDRRDQGGGQGGGDQGGGQGNGGQGGGGQGGGQGNGGQGGNNRDQGVL
ncbi:transglycosylase domain-containing protein [Actinomyces oris]